MDTKPKVITLCGSSRFVDIMAVCAWILERDELAICMSLHLLPWWYGGADGTVDDHLAESEGCANEMDNLHLRKIDLSDEIFVVDGNVNGTPYVGSSTSNEIRYAEGLGIPVRRLSEDFIRHEVYRRITEAVERTKAASQQ